MQDGDLLPFAYRGLDNGAVFDFKITQQELGFLGAHSTVLTPQDLSAVESKLKLARLNKDLEFTWLVKSNRAQQPFALLIFNSSLDSVSSEKATLALDAIGQIVNSLELNQLLKADRSTHYFVADLKNNHELRTSTVDGSIKSLLLFRSDLFLDSIACLLPSIEKNFIETIAHRHLSSLLQNYHSGTIYLRDTLIFLVRIEVSELQSHVLPLIKDSFLELFGFGSQERSIEYFETRMPEYLIELASETIK